jgi:hypothetical protein
MTSHLIYIAGPYTKPDPIINTRKAASVGMKIHEDTMAGVIIPHLSLLAHAMFPRELEYWYAFDLAQVAACTAVCRIPGVSVGADAEEAFARQRGIPVFSSTWDGLNALYKFLSADPS